MEHDFDADALAEDLYGVRAILLFQLTEQGVLPPYLLDPLNHAIEHVQEMIQELEQRHNCREQGVIDLGLGNGLPN